MSRNECLSTGAVREALTMVHEKLLELFMK